ncbi:MAG: zinc ribbon domain-containing protein [Nitrosomonas sp.]|nr:zinc ribbon domain-containing protein [Nitrosomonas sp.]
MMFCPKCGTENTDQAESCSYCHESLLNKLQTNADTNQHKSNEQIDQRETKTSDALTVTEKETDHANANEKPVVSMGLNIAIILGTIIFPVVGVAMGYTYFKKSHPDAKKAGRNWLILGLVMILVNILLVNSIK